MPRARLGVRWTIGDVSTAGFEALRLSIVGAARCFGTSARYVVCVNTLSCEEVRRRVGPLPLDIGYRSVTRADIPRRIDARLDERVSQGTAWKFAPLRVFESIHELALDNDCILWRVPPAVREWLDDPDPFSTLLAEDVVPCHGRFASLCGDGARNSGIRGIGPAFDLESALYAVLERIDAKLDSELDEQGLQVAALSRRRPPYVVSVDDVTICSPVPPHLPNLGRAGAHFVGLNARAPWCHIGGRPVTDLVQDHWRTLRPRVVAQIDEQWR